MIVMFDDDYEVPIPDHYTFVYEDENKGWWLKISDPEVLCYYHLHVDHWAKALKDYLYNDRRHYTSTLTTAIVMYAEKKGLTILDAIMQFRMNVFSEQCKVIKEYGAICINKSGGYHGVGEYSQFVNKKEMIWPDYKQSDIKITQFPGGTHWYVRINDFEVRENDKIKWDTYDEAYKIAQQFVQRSEKNG